MQIEKSANVQLIDLQQKVALLLEERDRSNILLAERLRTIECAAAANH
jgi:hypothetical protein